jgi:hypothetical protein
MWWWGGPKVPQRRRYCHSAALGAGASNLRACSHRISTFSYITFCSSTAVGSISSETRICTTRGVACHISKDEEEKQLPCRVGGRKSGEIRDRRRVSSIGLTKMSYAYLFKYIIIGDTGWFC